MTDSFEICEAEADPLSGTAADETGLCGYLGDIARSKYRAGNKVTAVARSVRRGRRRCDRTLNHTRTYYASLCTNTKRNNTDGGGRKAAQTWCEMSGLAANSLPASHRTIRRPPLWRTTRGRPRSRADLNPAPFAEEEPHRDRRYLASVERRSSFGPCSAEPTPDCLWRGRDRAAMAKTPTP